MKLSSWPEIGSDGDILLTPYVPKGITGYDDDDDSHNFGLFMIPGTYPSAMEHSGLRWKRSIGLSPEFFHRLLGAVVKCDLPPVSW